MIVFITGGCKNGKSSIAEDLCMRLAGGGPLYYVATMKAYDDEDRLRIKRHVAQRDGKGFVTIEQPVCIKGILEKTDAAHSTYLVDSVTALLINEMYGPCTEKDGMYCDVSAPERVAAELAFTANMAGNMVLVSDYIYAEAGRYSRYTTDYMKALALTDRELARVSDVVCEVSFGNVITYKGVFPL